MFDKLIQQVNQYESDEESYQENKLRHRVALRTLYRQFPEIYFNKYYYFKTFKDSNLKDWKTFENIVGLYEENKIH